MENTINIFNKYIVNLPKDIKYDVIKYFNENFSYQTLKEKDSIIMKLIYIEYLKNIKVLNSLKF